MVFSGDNWTKVRQVMEMKVLVMSESLWPHRLHSTRLLCPWDSPSKNTGVRCHALLQGIFLIQGSKLRLMPCALASKFFTASATWEAHICKLQGSKLTCWILTASWQIWVQFSNWFAHQILANWPPLGLDRETGMIQCYLRLFKGMTCPPCLVQQKVPTTSRVYWPKFSL